MISCKCNHLKHYGNEMAISTCSWGTRWLIWIQFLNSSTNFKRYDHLQVTMPIRKPQEQIFTISVLIPQQTSNLTSTIGMKP